MHSFWRSFSDPKQPMLLITGSIVTAVLTLFLSSMSSSTLPLKVIPRAKAAVPVTFTGKVFHLNGYYYLLSGDGTYILLRGNVPAFQSGSEISVSGVMEGNLMFVQPLTAR